jgi:hypothetical protein
MQWEFTFKEHPLLLNIKVTGEIHRKEVIKMSIDAIALAKTKKCKRVLLDCRNAMLRDSQVDIYKFSSNLDKTGLKRTDKVAVVILHNVASYRFAETVSSNRGWTKIKYFEDMDDARNWVSK